MILYQLGMSPHTYVHHTDVNGSNAIRNMQSVSVGGIRPSFDARQAVAAHDGWACVLPYR